MSSGVFNAASKNVPGTDLAPSGSIGVWMKLTLPAGTSPNKSTCTVTIAGSTV